MDLDPQGGQSIRQEFVGGKREEVVERRFGPGKDVVESS
jgi:hypothetical protein